MIEKRFGTLGSLEVPVLVYESIDEADKAAGKPGNMLDSANDNLHYRGGPAEDTRQYVCDMLEGLGKTYEKDGTFEDSDGNTANVIAGEKIVRFTKPALDKDKKPKTVDGKPVMVPCESQGDFARRFCALQGWDDLKQFQPQIDAWAKSIPDTDAEGNEIPGQVHALAVDARTPERKAKAPTKLAAKYKVAAAKVITKGTVDSVNFNQLAKINKSFAPAPSAEGEVVKLYTGTYPDGQNEDGSPKQVSFSVSDKDADTLGWLIKEYFDWKAQQEMLAI